MMNQGLILSLSSFGGVGFDIPLYLIKLEWGVSNRSQDRSVFRIAR